MTNQNKSHSGGSRVGPPLTRWSVKDVLIRAEQVGDCVMALKAGHGEIWNKEHEAVGWIDAKQLAQVRRSLKECGRCGLLKAPSAFGAATEEVCGACMPKAAARNS